MGVNAMAANRKISAWYIIVQILNKIRYRTAS